MEEENKRLKEYCCKRNECSGRLKENHKLTGYEIINNLEKWLEQEIGKLEEYGASFGLTIDEQISEYITDKISGYKNSLLKLRELKGSDK